LAAIYFERTRDLALVRELIAGDARIYDAASDDSAPARDVWLPHADERVWYVTASEGERLATLFTLWPDNAVCWQIHCTRMFGGAVARAWRAIGPWMFAASGCRRIVAAVPATNPAAVRCVRAAGFVEFGRNPRSFLKRGELVDQILFGLSPS